MTPLRTVVLLLLLANLTFFAYTRLDSAGGGEAVRLAEQVQPDKIKLLTPQQVAALGPGKVAALADVCLEWGPIAEGDRARSLAELEPLALGKLLTQRRIETSMAFWVFLPPAANRAEAERRADRSQGARHQQRVDRRQRPAAQRRIAGRVRVRGGGDGPARRRRAAGRGECQAGAAPASRHVDFFRHSRSAGAGHRARSRSRARLPGQRSEDRQLRKGAVSFRR